MKRSPGIRLGARMSKKTRSWIVIASLAATLNMAAPALGAECDDVSVPDSAKVANADLVLNGLGIRKATFLKVKVYVAGLYLPQKSTDSAEILSANAPWQVALHFVRDVGASDMHDAFDEGFEKSAGDKLAALKDRIEALKASLTDFKEGDSLAFTHDPAQGVTVGVNGTNSSAIQGDDFADALLSIWIGKDPPNKEIKVGLLGGKCE